MLMVIFLYLERLREIDLCIQGIADLANIQPDRVVVANIFTIGYDLNELALQPGEVVDLVLANSAGSDHSFILSNPFNSLYQYKNNFYLHTEPHKCQELHLMHQQISLYHQKR